MSVQFDVNDPSGEGGDLFESPASTAALDLTELTGRLLLIKPHRWERDVNTSLGVKDAVVADVTVLDGDDEPPLTDVFVWPVVLQSQLKSTVGTGKYCLGRLGKGVAKPGQNPPWKLADPTGDDQRLARKYLADQPNF